MQEEIISHANHLLETIINPTIATTDRFGNPWAAPQFMAYDSTKQTYYWCADRQSQHGKNISNNPNVYIVVYDSMAAPGAGDAVYVRAKAQIVSNHKEVDEAFALLLKKHAGVPYWGIDDIKTVGSPLVLFKAKIREAWVNKDRQKDGYFVLYREAVELTD